MNSGSTQRGAAGSLDQNLRAQLDWNRSLDPAGRALSEFQQRVGLPRAGNIQLAVVVPPLIARFCWTICAPTKLRLLCVKQALLLKVLPALERLQTRNVSSPGIPFCRWSPERPDTSCFQSIANMGPKINNGGKTSSPDSLIITNVSRPPGRASVSASGRGVHRHGTLFGTNTYADETQALHNKAPLR